MKSAVTEAGTQTEMLTTSVGVGSDGVCVQQMTGFWEAINEKPDEGLVETESDQLDSIETLDIDEDLGVDRTVEMLEESEHHGIVVDDDTNFELNIPLPIFMNSHHFQAHNFQSNFQEFEKIVSSKTQATSSWQPCRSRCNHHRQHTT